MEYDIVNKFNIEEMTANCWRPIDYEILELKGKFEKWFYWKNLCYIEFTMEHSKPGGWN